MKIRSWLAGVWVSATLGCSSAPTTEQPTLPDGGKAPITPTGATGGKLYYEAPTVETSIYEYDFATSTETKLFEGCEAPSVHGTDFLCIDPSDLTAGFDPFNIYVTDRTGLQRKKVIDTTINASTDFSGTKWSPDGSKFAFSNYHARDAVKREDYAPQEATIVHAKDGTKIAELPGLFHPAWMPDGRMVLTGTLLFIGEARVPKTDGIYIVDATFANPQRIDQNITHAVQPSVSPDGTRIAFSAQNHIFTIKPDGSGLQQITTGDKTETSPAWSPDGTKIACVAFGTFEGTNFFAAVAVVDANATTPTAITPGASVWPRQKNTSDSTGGRLNANQSLTWLP